MVPVEEKQHGIQILALLPDCFLKQFATPENSGRVVFTGTRQSTKGKQ